jgi:hypothetical protein
MKQRPVILSAEVRENMSEVEKFQNTTLRPVIKMLHPILILSFKNYLQHKMKVFFDVSGEKRLAYIDAIFQKDIPYKNQLKGMVIGHFTSEEFEIYTSFESEFNKRILNIVKERICNSMSELLQA